MKLLDFSRDSDVMVSINRAVNGTYDVSIQGKGITEGLNIYQAWLAARDAQLNELKVPAKFMHEFAHLAIQHAHNTNPKWIVDVEKLQSNWIIDEANLQNAVAKYENKYPNTKVEIKNAE